MFADGSSGQEKKMTNVGKLVVEDFHRMAIKGAIHDIIDLDNDDLAKSRLRELADWTSKNMDIKTEITFWSMFWKTIHEISLSNFDDGAQQRIRDARKYVTDQITRLEDMQSGE